MAIDQHSQQRKQCRSPLHLIQDHELLCRLERQQRLSELAERNGVLQIEPRVFEGRDDLPSQGRLAALSRPENANDRAACERCHDAAQKGVSRDHRRIIALTLKTRNANPNFQG